MSSPFLAGPFQPNWNPLTTYVFGNVVFHNAGLWFFVSEKPRRNSEPIVGNADWTLVAGTPYLIIDLTADQLRVFQSSPIGVILPAPGLGKLLKFVKFAAQVVPGSVPFAENLSSGFEYNNGSGTVLNTGTLQLGDAAGNGLAILSNGIEKVNLNLLIGDIENVGFIFSNPSDDFSGGIASTSINAPGSGYAPDDTFTIDGALGLPPAGGTVDTVDGGGAVLTYHITRNGFGYFAATGITTTATSGIGTGLILDINTITPANGSARVWLYYDLLNLL